MNARRAAQLLKPYLSTLTAEVQAELRIVTPEQLTLPYLLHISKDPTLSKFIPGVSRRSMVRENRTVARVCTATTLVGCLNGYASDIHDFLIREDGLRADGSKRVKFLGGYTIYGFRYPLALSPSRKLVPDVERTDEHWLVPFNAEHATYQGEVLGKVFYETMRYQMVGGRMTTVIEMYVEVTSDEPIWFDGKTCLTKGYWRAVTHDMHRTRSWRKVQAELEEIQSPRYLAVKRSVASMLSLEHFGHAGAAW